MACDAGDDDALRVGVAMLIGEVVCIVKPSEPYGGVGGCDVGGVVEGDEEQKGPVDSSSLYKSGPAAAAVGHIDALSEVQSMGSRKRRLYRTSVLWKDSETRRYLVLTCT